MRTAIESINFEPGEDLKRFIIKASQAFYKIEQATVFAEYNLAFKNGGYECTIILVVTGKNVVVTQTASDMYSAVMNVMAHTKQYLLQNKIRDRAFALLLSKEAGSGFRVMANDFKFNAN